jgi:protocatechuate 3,4-dioxygenase beta subunit
MKIPTPNSLLKHAFLALSGFIAAAVTALANPACVIPTPAQQPFSPPITIESAPGINGVAANAQTSFIKVTLANVPGGYSVTNGTPYIGWCVDAPGDLCPVSFCPGNIYKPILANSCDPVSLAALGLPTANWDKVNYIINHKAGANASTVQAAIWSFIGGTPGDIADIMSGSGFYNSLFGFAAGNSTQLTALINAANANGVNFMPGSGDVTAIVLKLPGQGNPDGQINFIEVNCPPGSIGDTVFCDFNRDGVQQAGEPGLPNVKVTLTCVTTNSTVTKTAFTDANGKYLFTQLPASTCTVTVDQTTAPAGCNIVIPNCPLTKTVNLAAGQIYLDADFCFGTSGSIGDTVFCDFNRNGVQDAGEPGLQGVKVTLTGNSITQTAFTNANGNYLFAGLPPGSYTVTVDQTTAPAGCNIVIPNCPLTRTVNLALAQTFLDADFCFGTSGSIGDTVFCDFNRDGVQQAGEPGIQNVKVTLTGNNITQMALTNASGKYLFTDLPPGTYTVTVDPTSAPAGCNVVIPNCPLTRTVNLVLAQTFLDADFCFGTNGAIGDTVFCDFNRDGVQQAGEPGLQNVKVTLTGNSMVQTAFTDANGKYLFNGLAPGNYTVTVDQTTAPVGCNVVIPNCPLTQTVNLALGQIYLDADFCLGTNGAIGDTVFCDFNRDGVQQAGEPGLQNVKVTLNGTTTSGASVMQMALTDASGKYLFNGLAPGNYTVTVDQTTAPAGCNVIIPNCPLTRTVSLALAQINLNADFCFGTNGAIGDTVFCDYSRDGVQQAGEPGLQNVKVTLNGTTASGGSVLQMAFTDANGKYLFNGLAPGNYTVTVDQTTAPANCNIVLPNCPLSRTVSLALAQIYLDADFCFGRSLCPQGVIGPIDLSGLANNFLFFFANGTQDANWQGATKGFEGNVLVSGSAKFRTSGGVPFAGTIYTDGSSIGQWQQIVNQNPGQAFTSFGNTSLVSSSKTTLVNAIKQINALPVTTGYSSVSAASLNGLNTTSNPNKLFVINITSGFQVSSQINITGNADQVFILRWDTDANPANGFQGQVKFQSGGAIVPKGGLTAANFIHVAGDMNASGGGGNPPAPYPQGPRYANGTGSIISGGANWGGGGFFTGYWLTTGSPDNYDPTTGLYYGKTSNFSNAIFVGGWYTCTNQFSMTSGTSGVYVAPNCP